MKCITTGIPAGWIRLSPEEGLPLQDAIAWNAVIRASDRMQSFTTSWAARVRSFMSDALRELEAAHPGTFPDKVLITHSESDDGDVEVYYLGDIVTEEDRHLVVLTVMHTVNEITQIYYTAIEWHTADEEWAPANPPASNDRVGAVYYTYNDGRPRATEPKIVSILAALDLPTH